MRVLLIPELYWPTDATANESLNDLVTLVDRDWVTLLEAEHHRSQRADEDVTVESDHVDEG